MATTANRAYPRGDDPPNPFVCLPAGQALRSGSGEGEYGLEVAMPAFAIGEPVLAGDDLGLHLGPGVDVGRYRPPDLGVTGAVLLLQ